MTDNRADEEADRPTAPEPPAAEPNAVERRAFLRQLTGEAVVTTGRLAGLSMAVRRSLFVAAESATRDLVPADDARAALSTEPAESPGSPVEPLAADPAAPAEASRPFPPAVPSPPAALTAPQEALLFEAATAVLGTNDAAGAPHLTASRFHWDGTIIRLPSDLFAARVERIGADARVSLLVAAENPDTWVSINGTASVVSGDAVEAGMLTILRKYMTDDEAAAAWSELRASGNPVVIEVRPSRYLWRLG